MGKFSKDGSTQALGAGVNSVYIKLGGGKSIAEIFPTRGSASSSVQFIGSPSESGLTVFDNKVRMPVVVDFTGIVKSGSFSCLDAARKQLKENKVVRGEYYGKNGYYENMMIEAIDEISNAEMFDGIEVHIRMKEFLEEGT